MKSGRWGSRRRSPGQPPEPYLGGAGFSSARAGSTGLSWADMKIKSLEKDIEHLKAALKAGGHYEDEESWRHELFLAKRELASLKKHEEARVPSKMGSPATTRSRRWERQRRKMLKDTEQEAIDFIRKNAHPVSDDLVANPDPQVTGVWLVLDRKNKLGHIVYLSDEPSGGDFETVDDYDAAVKEFNRVGPTVLRDQIEQAIDKIVEQSAGFEVGGFEGF